MTCQERWGKELLSRQFHSPAFQEALLIGLREALQLGWRDPRSIAEVHKQEFPDPLEKRSLHRRIEPWHEGLQVGFEKAQGLISAIPGPACPMAEGSPVIWL